MYKSCMYKSSTLVRGWSYTVSTRIYLYSIIIILFPLWKIYLLFRLKNMSPLGNTFPLKIHVPFEKIGFHLKYISYFEKSFPVILENGPLLRSIFPEKVIFLCLKNNFIIGLNKRNIWRFLCFALLTT